MCCKPLYYAFGKATNDGTPKRRFRALFHSQLHRYQHPKVLIRRGEAADYKDDIIRALIDYLRGTGTESQSEQRYVTKMSSIRNSLTTTLVVCFD